MQRCRYSVRSGVMRDGVIGNSYIERSTVKPMSVLYVQQYCRIRTTYSVHACCCCLLRTSNPVVPNGDGTTNNNNNYNNNRTIQDIGPGMQIVVLDHAQCGECYVSRMNQATRRRTRQHLTSPFANRQPPKPHGQHHDANRPDTATPS